MFVSKFFRSLMPFKRATERPGQAFSFPKDRARVLKLCRRSSLVDGEWFRLLKSERTAAGFIQQDVLCDCDSLSEESNCSRRCQSSAAAYRIPFRFETVID